MNLKEIMMTVNSDITKPLNNLISELSDEQVVLLNNVLDKLNNISTGGGTGSSGNKPFYTSGFEKDIIDINPSVSTLPYNFYGGSAVVYNNEIHILGSGSNNYTKHYKWNGTSWTSVSTLPYEFYYGSAVVYNNEIHILGSGSSYRTNHYKWNGTSWTSVSTLPYEFYNGSAVVYNNEIHIMAGGYSSGSSNTNHYKWDGTSWTSVSTLPYNFYQGSAVVYNNEIHILGSGGSSSNNYHYNKHYKWDGASWTSVSTLPYIFFQGSAVVYNNEIHILGSSISDYYTKHYKLTKKSLYKIYLLSGSIIYFYDNRISSITEKTNCTKQSDNSILVNSNGLVEFEIVNSIRSNEDDIKYTIY